MDAYGLLAAFVLGIVLMALAMATDEVIFGAFRGDYDD